MKPIKEILFEEDWKGECDNCGSIFEAHITELDRIYLEDKDVETAYSHHYCMVCRKHEGIVFYQKDYYDELNQNKN